jgi:hypothetical protein
MTLARPERLAEDKRSSLFGLFAGDEEKSLQRFSPGSVLDDG